jgi:hypothetical protein
MSLFSNHQPCKKENKKELTPTPTFISFSDFTSICPCLIIAMAAAADDNWKEGLTAPKKDERFKTEVRGVV